MNQTIAPTPEAIRRLNLSVDYKPNGEIISSRTRNRTLLEELVGIGFIEEYHAEYAMTYAMLRDVWLGKLSCHAAMLSDAIGALAPHISAHDLYDGVRTRIKARRARLVLLAVESPCERVMAPVGEIYRHALDVLADAFTEAHKELDGKHERR